jgi:hypothetical protein
VFWENVSPEATRVLLNKKLFGHKIRENLAEQTKAHPDLKDPLAELDKVTQGFVAKVAARKDMDGKLIVVIIPAVASVLPGVELNYRLALIPVLNVSLVSKEVLSGTFHWHYIALIFGSTCVYAAAALAVAVALFKRESVLFRT